MNEIDKQTNGPFLIKLCFDVKTLPVIAKKPVVEPIVDDIEEIALPRIVTTLVTPTEISPHEVSNAFVSRLLDLLLYMNNMSYQVFKDSVDNDSEKLTLATLLLGRKLFNRLTEYIKLNIPSKKSHLFPNKHWMWDSNRSYHIWIEYPYIYDNLDNNSKVLLLFISNFISMYYIT